MGLWVKLCGMRTHRDVEAAVSAGADAVGFVLTPSIRQVELKLAAELIAELPREVASVAVFYQPERPVVEQARDGAAFDLFQAETAHLAAIDGIATLPVVHDSVRLGAAVDDAFRGSTSGTILLEGFGKGGRGRTPDADRVERLAPLDHIVLAGGLTPENVAGTVVRFRPHGVDVSSGIEATPGAKDSDLMSRFVVAAREAALGVGS